MNILIRRRFGLAAHLWRDVAIDTADGHHVAAAVEAATSGALVNVVGPRGSGKTFGVRAALRGRDVAVVEPLRLDRERLHLGDVQVAVVRELSDERPRTSGEARSGQVRRLLAAASAARPVLLVIDDAHVLHHATVRGLKRLLELSHGGRSPLLGIVLLGQVDRAGRIPEVGLRAATVRLGGLMNAEATAAVSQALGAVVTLEAAQRIGSDAPGNWLDLQACVDDALVAAAARGDARLTVAAVEAARAPAPQAPAPAAPGDDAVAAALGRTGRRRAA